MANDMLANSTKRDFMRNRKRITEALNYNLDNNAMIDNPKTALEVASVMMAKDQHDSGKPGSRLKTADRVNRVQRLSNTAGNTHRGILADKIKSPYETVKMMFDGGDVTS